MPRKHNRKILVLLVIVAVTIAWLFTLPGPRAQATDDENLFDAICPIIYPVDQSSSDRGYHYLFYGNGFFINSDGYLLTAAHVLSQLHGGQPYVLLHQSSSEFRIVQAALVAMDREHDVAILRVSPNPFTGNYKVSSLPLSPERPLLGQTALSAALLPSKPREAYTANATIEMRARGEVLDSEFSQLEKGKADTELLIFGHEVILGQSGAPVISAESQSVVGLVEGQWFGHNPLAMVAAERRQLGAILPIHYAIALLQQKRIAWHTSEHSQEQNHQNVADLAQNALLPEALSLVPAAYPSQSIFGGEVILDARMDSTTGTLADIQTIHGEAPYLEKSLAAVRTWTFLVADHGSPSLSPRIGIVFNFVPRLAPSKAPKTHSYENAPNASPEQNSADRAALPVATVEPAYPNDANVQSSVILSVEIDKEGQLHTVQILRGAEPFTTSATAALHQWRFEPAKHLGASISSRGIIIFTFAQPLLTSKTQSPRSSQ